MRPAGSIRHRPHPGAAGNPRTFRDPMDNIVIMSLSLAPLGWSESVVWHDDCGAGRDDTETDRRSAGFEILWPSFDG
jgi:hypothetical protein